MRSLKIALLGVLSAFCFGAVLHAAEVLRAGGTWPVYVPDIRSAAYGGFGAYDGPGGMIEVGAGEKIFNKMVENYYRVTGVFQE